MPALSTQTAVPCLPSFLQAWQKTKEAVPVTKEFSAKHGVTGTHIGTLAGTHTTTGTGSGIIM